MLPRALASLLCLLGAAALGLGVASATLWRADDTLVATVEATTLVATEPGVLDLAADEVTIRAEAQGDVVIALGRAADVEAWIGTDPHTWVTGLVDRHTLSTRDVTGASPSPTAAVEATAEPTAEPTGEDAAGAGDAAGVADPTGSDLWVAEATGTGEAELGWSRRDGRWSVVVAAVGPDAGPVTLELTWPQVVTTPWLVPGLVLGGLLLVVGLLWWVVLLWGTRWLGPVGTLSRAWSTRLLVLLRHEEPEEPDHGPSTHPVPVVARARHATGEVARVEVTQPGRFTRAVGVGSDPVPDDGAPLTRRQLRERAAAAAEAAGTARTAPADVERAADVQTADVQTADMATVDEQAVVAPPTPTTEPTTEPTSSGPATPAIRRLVDRVRHSTRRRPADVVETPAAAPEPVAQVPAPVTRAAAPSASADAWRRAWGIPSVEQTGEPGDAPPDDRSTDASEGEGR